MADYLIRIVAYASGNYTPPEIADRYVKTFDHEAFSGRGFLTCTADPAEALRFPNQVEAFAFWRKQSASRPIRDDGKPNRPMTAFTASVEPAPERPSSLTEILKSLPVLGTLNVDDPHDPKNRFEI